MLCEGKGGGGGVGVCAPGLEGAGIDLHNGTLDQSLGANLGRACQLQAMDWKDGLDRLTNSLLEAL
jgi:hypothetical protein